MNAAGHRFAWARRSRRRTFQVLVDEVVELGPPALVAGGVHVGEVVGNDFGPVFLSQHARRRDL